VIEERARFSSTGFTPVGHVCLRLDAMQALLLPRAHTAMPTALLPSNARLWARVRDHAKVAARALGAPSHVVRSQAQCARAMRREAAGGRFAGALALAQAAQRADDAAVAAAGADGGGGAADGGSDDDGDDEARGAAADGGDASHVESIFNDADESDGSADDDADADGASLVAAAARAAAAAAARGAGAETESERHFAQCSLVIERAVRGWVARHQLERLGILYVTVLDGCDLELDALRKRGGAAARLHAELTVTGDRRAATTQRLTQGVALGAEPSVYWGTTFAILWRGARARLTVRVRDAFGVDANGACMPVGAMPLLVSELPRPAEDPSAAQTDAAHEMELPLMPTVTSTAFSLAAAAFLAPAAPASGGGGATAGGRRKLHRRDSQIPLNAMTEAAAAPSGRKGAALGSVRLHVAYRPLSGAEAEQMLGLPVAFALSDGEGGARKSTMWEQMAPTRIFGARRTTVGRGLESTPAVGQLCVRLKYWDSQMSTHAGSESSDV
jgi:hypothetical protein